MTQGAAQGRIARLLGRLGDELFAFSSPGDAPAARWAVRYLTVAVVLALVVIARKPDAVRNPQFWGDDNTLFVQQLTLGFWSALRALYVGFPYVVHRLIPALAGFLPVARAPLVYSLSAIATTALTMATFSLPGFRHLVRNDWLRAACCVAIVCIPAGQGLVATLTNVGFFLGIWLVLLAVMRVPRTVVGTAGCCAGAALAISSTALWPVVAPLWALRVAAGWHAHRRREVAFAGAQIAALLVVVATSGTGSAGMGTTGGAGSPTVTWRLGYLGPALRSLGWVVTAHIDSAMLPPAAFARLEALGALPVAAFALLVLLCVALAGRDLPERGRVTLCLALYLSISSLFLVLAGRPATVLVLRGEMLPGLKLPTFQIIGARHRALANASVVLAVSAVLDGARRLPTRIVAVATCIGLLCAWGPEFRVAPFPDLRWPKWAASIEQHLDSPGSPPLVVPSYPPGYEIHLDRGAAK